MPAAPRNAPPPAVASHDALPAGTCVEEFVIERVLSASGFGIVYLASDPALKRQIAIKEYLPLALAARATRDTQLQLRAPAHAEAFERGRGAFIEESQLLARCNHPSLLHVTRSWEANGTAYRAMPHYAGHSVLALRQTLNEPPDEASLRSLLDGVLGALEVLHRAGRIHGQIAPGRILLMPDDHPVLLDFGAARRAVVGEQTQALMMLLEPTFAPMEQIAPSSGQPIGPWTDLYALAATVHYCVSGRLPAAPSGWLPEPHEPLAEVLRRLQRNLPRLHYSKAFIDAIDAALSVRPRDRPQSLAQFRALLDIPVAPASAPSEPAPKVAPQPVPQAVPQATPQSAPQPAPQAAAQVERPARQAAPPAKQATPQAAPQATPQATPQAAPQAESPAPQPAPQPARNNNVADADEPTLVVPRPVAARSPAAAWPNEAITVFRAEPLVTPRAPAPAKTAQPPIHVPIASATRRTPPHRGYRHAALWGGSIVALAVLGAGAWTLGQRHMFDDVTDMLGRAAMLIAGADPQRSARPGAAPPPATPPALADATELPQAPTGAIASPTAVEVAAPATAPAPPTPQAAATPATDTAIAPAAAAIAPRNAQAAEQPVATPRTAPPAAAAAKPAIGPRQVCGERTQFALYRCVVVLCAQAKWAQHAQCKWLRSHDDVPEE